MICPRSRSHRFANMTGLWHSLRKVEVLTTPWIRILIHSPTMFFALKNAISAKFVAIFKKSEQAQADNKLNPPKNRIREAAAQFKEAIKRRFGKQEELSFTEFINEPLPADFYPTSRPYISNPESNHEEFQLQEPWISNSDTVPHSWNEEVPFEFDIETGAFIRTDLTQAVFTSSNSHITLTEIDEDSLFYYESSPSYSSTVSSTRSNNGSD
jgi:hypothetical protein